MVARVLNIWVIKQRGQSAPRSAHKQPPAAGDGSSPTEYLVDLGDGRSVCLRGTADDLQAITTSVWLRAKTYIESYLEAVSKLVVYLVAAFSSNMSQAGAIIFVALLIANVGLLGLSNARARAYKMHGRVAAPVAHPRGPAADGVRNGNGVRTGLGPARWRGPANPSAAVSETNGWTGDEEA